MVPFDRWLASELSLRLKTPVPRSLARRAILGGMVSVQGKITRDPETEIRRGRSVFIRSLEWLPGGTPSEPAPLVVLFEDEWIIAVDKPAGLPTHETKDPHRANLKRLIERHTGKAAFVHQRLDAGASGVVLFAKASSVNGNLARAFASRSVGKSYLAIVSPPAVDWPDKFAVTTPLCVLPNGSVTVDPEGDPAETEIRVVKRSQGAWLIQAAPLTGRKHQIRVHLSSLGAPILGDDRYGARTAARDRLMLHSHELVISHPRTGKRTVIRTPPPAAFRRAIESVVRVRSVANSPKPAPDDAGGRRRASQGAGVRQSGESSMPKPDHILSMRRRRRPARAADSRR